MKNYKCKSVGIIGAGIQGICIGLQLINKGIPVTIFDNTNPTDKEFTPASYGNAGHFSPYAVLQFNEAGKLSHYTNAFKFYRSTCFKMELCSKNDSLVFTVI